MTEVNDMWINADAEPGAGAVAGGSRQPADRDAEASLLAKLMLPTETSFDEIGALRPSDFFDPAHAAIFAAMLELNADGQPTHAQALAAHLDSNGGLRRVRGIGYLNEVFTHPLAVTAGPWNATRIIELARLRAVIEFSGRAGQLARQPGMASGDVIAKLQDALNALAEGVLTAGAVVWRDLLAETIADLETREREDPDKRGVMTGFADLDRLLGGLKPGQLVIIGARPAMGKTALAGDLVRSAVFKHSVPTLFFSMEMHRAEIARRILAAQYRIPLFRLNSAEMADDDWIRLLDLSADHAGAPLWVDDSADRTLADIRSEARRLARRNGLGLLVVDYLGLIRSVGGRSAESRQQEVAANARGLKVLAKELGVPAVVCAQINRGPEQRQDKRPQLADLRDSGAIEADADIVILLHREDYYDPEGPRAGEADLIVAKQRGGPTDTVTVANQLAYGRFADMAVMGP